MLDFPSGSDGKESACNAGDPGSIPGSGRYPGEGNPSIPMTSARYAGVEHVSCHNVFPPKLACGPSLQRCLSETQISDFPGGPGVRNLPAVTCSITDPGRFHMPLGS